MKRETMKPTLIKTVQVLFALVLTLGLMVPILTSNRHDALAVDDYKVNITVDGFGAIDEILVSDGNAIALEQLEETAGFPAFQKEQGDKIFVLIDDVTGIKYYKGGDIEPVTSNLTLRGYYEESPTYSVSVNYGNGQKGQDVDIPRGQSWTDAGNAVPANPTKSGYTFNGWLDEDGKPFDWDAIYDTDKDVSVQWKANNDNSGAADVVPPEVVTGMAKSIKSWKGAVTSWGAERRFLMKETSASDEWFDSKFNRIVATCADPGAWSAHKGDFSYTATRTKWDETTGEWEYEIVFSPTDSTCNKAYSGTHSATGALYQHKSGTSQGLQRGVAWMSGKEDVKVPIKVVKSSTLPAISEDNSCYDMAGTTYGLYESRAGAASDANRMATLTLDSKGFSGQSNPLVQGEYYVKELTAGKGFALNRTAGDNKDGIVTVTVDKASAIDGAVPVYVDDVPKNDPVRVVVEKRDKETDETSPLAGAKLEGAEFKIEYYDTYSNSRPSGTPLKVWVIKTNENGSATLAEKYVVEDKSDTLYRNENGTAVFPLGTYVIQEIKAPDGYLINDEVFVRQIIDPEERTGQNDVIETYNYPVVPDVPKRGDVKFTKVNGLTMESIPNAVFSLTELTTKEVHYIVTDENGQFSTSNDWNPHSENTNGNDAAVTVNADGTYTVDESQLDPYAGVWFGTNGNGTKAPLDEKKLALPYGKYELKELSTSANKGLYLVTKTFTVSRNNVLIDLGTMDEAPVGMGTTATNADDGSKFVTPSGTVRIKDVIQYEGLTPGVEYTVEGTIMNTDTENAVEAEGATKSEKFTPKTSTGSFEMIFEFDATGNDGADFVVFEKILRPDGSILTSHEDLTDEGQTVRTSVEIGTTATNAADGSHTAKSDGEITINDVVHYKGLSTEETYIAKGTLMNKETGEPFTIDGQELTEMVEFKPAETEGDVTVTFTFDGTKVEAGKVVVFETVFKADRTSVVGKHEDLNDEGQTIEIEPTMGTTAEGEDGSKEIQTTSVVKLVDHVAYSGLNPEKEYALTGKVMDKATGEVYVDANGNEVVKTETFRPEATSGVYDMTFEFEVADNFDGEMVVFESLAKDDGTELIAHADINDEGQTIKVKLTMQTQAEDVDGNKIFPALTKLTVVDHITYKGLKVGKEYKVSGTIMDKDTGEAYKDAEGNEIVVTTTFTPEQSDGVYDMTFEFDASGTPNANLVVFEDLLTPEDKLIVRHADLEDEAQTITLKPEIGTIAKDAKDGDKVVTSEANATIIDTVYYKGLTPGVKYTTTCVMMNKETGEPFKVNGKEVTGTADFIPTDSEGEVAVTVQFDASSVADIDLVAFERVTVPGEGDEPEVVAVHEDINDQSQTISMEDGTIVSKLAKTGRTHGAAIALFVALVAAGIYSGRKLRNRYMIVNAA